MAAGDRGDDEAGRFAVESRYRVSTTERAQRVSGGVPPAMRSVRCRNRDCQQVLAIARGIGYDIHAQIMVDDRGRASLVCPVCGKARRFDRDTD